MNKKNKYTLRLVYKFLRSKRINLNEPRVVQFKDKITSYQNWKPKKDYWVREKEVKKLLKEILS